MAGRGGRGAALQQALLKQQKTPCAVGDVGQATATPPAPPAGAAPPVGVARGRGRGRGSLLNALVKSSDDSSAAPTPPPAPTPAPAPTPQPAAEPPTEQLAKLNVQRPPTVNMTGSYGKSVSLTANILELRSHTGGIFQYHVSFSPEVDSKGMRFRLLNEHRDRFPVKVFDGHILYIGEKLSQQEVTLTSTTHDGATVRLTVRYTKQVPLEEATHVFNVIFRKVMRELALVQVGRYHYNPSTPLAIPQHKLEIWPGYITAIAEKAGGLMLQADVSHRVLRTETVYSLMEQTVRGAAQHRSDNAHDLVEKSLLGAVVLTRYNNKTYRIDDVDWSKNPSSTFTNSQGETISFAQYYKRAYNKDIYDMRQPLLIHKPKVKGVESGTPQVICLVPELCYMTGLTDDLRSDFRVMKELASHTRVTPQQRRAALLKFIQNVRETPAAHQILQQWGLEFASDTVAVPGRQLEQERILMSNFSCLAGPNADWGREATRHPVLKAVDLTQWLLLYTARDKDKAQKFVDCLLSVTRDLGIRPHKPEMVELRSDRTDAYLEAIRSRINPSIQLVVTVVPSQREDRYSAIKRQCCCETPVPSQVIQGRTISQPQKLRAVTQKIALQINCKLGGELWSVKIPMNNFMIIGIDTYHEKAQRSRSVGGFVASMNTDCSQWYSRCCIQEAGQELVDGIKVCVGMALRHYHKKNHLLPERIIIFRDGVGDGHLNTVKKFEVEQLQSALKLFNEFGNYDPELCVVVVQKRINTRLFMRMGGDRMQLDNPAPGTVVDQTVTRREWYDFYLISQHVRQGTVTPTHYVVVHDTTRLKPDHVQSLAYKMTHMYYNWPGTVRVPAPCQYAHKLAYLVGQNLRRDTAVQLADRLFYL